MKPVPFNEATNFVPYERITDDNKIEKETAHFWTDGNQYVTCIEVSADELAQIKKTGRLYVVGKGFIPDNIILQSKNPLFRNGQEKKV